MKINNNESGIYKIVNVIDNKIYIGSSINFIIRKRIHFRDLKKNKHHSILLQRAWNKYGEENFQFEILEKIINLEKLIEREQYWMDTLNPEYNISLTAGSSLGIKRTEETKEKLRQIHMGEKHPEWRNQIKSIAQGGENHCTKKKKFSKESKKRMSEAHKKLYKNGYKHPGSISIKQYSLNNEFIRDWESTSQAARELNLNADAIRNCVRGKSKTSGGFKWFLKESSYEI